MPVLAANSYLIPLKPVAGDDLYCRMVAENSQPPGRSCRTVYNPPEVQLFTPQPTQPGLFSRLASCFKAAPVSDTFARVSALATGWQSVNRQEPPETHAPRLPEPETRPASQTEPLAATFRLCQTPR